MVVVQLLKIFGIADLLDSNMPDEVQLADYELPFEIMMENREDEQTSMNGTDYLQPSSGRLCTQYSAERSSNNSSELEGCHLQDVLPGTLLHIIRHAHVKQWFLNATVQLVSDVTSVSWHSSAVLEDVPSSSSSSWKMEDSSRCNAKISFQKSSLSSPRPQAFKQCATKPSRSRKQLAFSVMVSCSEPHTLLA